MLPSIDINYWAVLVSAVVSMVIGMAWYSQALFGKTWMKLMDITQKDIEKSKEKGMGKQMLAAFIAALILSYVLALFLRYIGVSTANEGLYVGFLVWLGFAATIMLNSVLWEGKPVKMYLINASHYLVNLLAMSLILSVWI